MYNVRELTAEKQRKEQQLDKLQKENADIIEAFIKLQYEIGELTRKCNQAYLQLKKDFPQ